MLYFKVTMLNKIVYLLKGLIKQPFKIGMISYYYPIEKNMNNGVALHSYYLSRELAKLGCDVHVFTRFSKKIKKIEYIGNGRIVVHGIVTSVGTKINDSVIEKRMNYFIFDNRVIEEISKENRIYPMRVIHSHGWLTAGVFISKYLNNIPWVHTFHALEKNRLKFMTSEEKKYFQIAKWMESTISSADAVISVSRKLREESLKEYEIKKERAFVIPNGVDREIFNTEGDIKKIKQVMFAGRFSLEKGIDMVPYIAQKILDSDESYKFVLVASSVNIPPSLIETRKQVETLEKTYGERFKWIKESISAREMSTLYKESMVYIQPSRYESFGMTVLEAMSCGCAVIVSNRGGLPEVVGNNGIALPLNINLFSEKATRLLKDYKLRERYVRRSIEKSQEFGWSRITNKTLDLYKMVSKKTPKEKKEQEEESKIAMDRIEKYASGNE